MSNGDHTLQSGILFGIEGVRIELQARYIPKPPKRKRVKRDGFTDFEDVPPDEIPWSKAIDITGLASAEVKETVQRIEGAFVKYDISPPLGQVLVNLAPAGIPKFGTALDLPIALVVLQAVGLLPDWPAEFERQYVFVGEVGLHGDLRPIQGALPIAFVLRDGESLILPKGNEKEACLVLGTRDRAKCNILPAATFAEVMEFARGKAKLPNAAANPPEFVPAVTKGTDFSVIKGQTAAKRAMEIAAAGGHNVLLSGPPGEGKSLLAGALPTILPRLTDEEKVDLTRIYSARGMLTEDGMIVSRRPFRPCHHTISKEALIGGGSKSPGPGEISLAHRGVLFLDELPEFSRGALEALRQPLESGEVQIARVGASFVFPCRFTLIAAMNPCPCGYAGQHLCKGCNQLCANPTTCDHCGKTEMKPRCICAPAAVTKYRKKLSGPILDRIDLKVDIQALTTEQKFAAASAESSADVRARVEAARTRQLERYKGTSILSNAAIPGGQLLKWCVFTDEGLKAYRGVLEGRHFSTRAGDRLAKTARTIADLSGAEKIEPAHILEAEKFLSGSVLA